MARNKLGHKDFNMSHIFYRLETRMDHSGNRLMEVCVRRGGCGSVNLPGNHQNKHPPPPAMVISALTYPIPPLQPLTYGGASVIFSETGVLFHQVRRIAYV